MTSMEIVHQGWLTKSPTSRGTFRPRWRRRWFVLRTGSFPNQFVLEYFTDESAKRHKGLINLDECEQLIGPLSVQERHKFTFQIRTPNRIYYLASDSEAEMTKWVASLCQVCCLKTTEVENQGTGTGTVVYSRGGDENQPATNSSISISSNNNQEEQETTATDSDGSSPTLSNKILSISSVSGPDMPISECITGKPIPKSELNDGTYCKNKKDKKKKHANSTNSNSNSQRSVISISTSETDQTDSAAPKRKKVYSHSQDYNCYSSGSEFQTILGTHPSSSSSKDSRKTRTQKLNSSASTSTSSNVIRLEPSPLPLPLENCENSQNSNFSSVSTGSKQSKKKSKTALSVDTQALNTTCSISTDDFDECSRGSESSLMSLDSDVEIKRKTIPATRQKYERKAKTSSSSNNSNCSSQSVICLSSSNSRSQSQRSLNSLNSLEDCEELESRSHKSLSSCEEIEDYVDVGIEEESQEDEIDMDMDMTLVPQNQNFESEIAVMSNFDLITNHATLKGGMEIFNDIVSKRINPAQLEHNFSDSNSSKSSITGSRNKRSRKLTNTSAGAGGGERFDGDTEAGSKKKRKGKGLALIGPEDLPQRKTRSATATATVATNANANADTSNNDEENAGAANEEKEAVIKSKGQAQFGELFRRFDLQKLSESSDSDPDKRSPRQFDNIAREFDLDRKNQLMCSMFSDFDEKKRMYEHHSGVVKELTTNDAKANFKKIRKHLLDIYEGRATCTRMQLFLSENAADRRKLKGLNVTDPFNSTIYMTLANKIIKYLLPNSDESERSRWSEYIQLVMLPEALIRIYARVNDISTDQAEKEMKFGPRYDGPIEKRVLGSRDSNNKANATVTTKTTVN